MKCNYFKHGYVTLKTLFVIVILVFPPSTNAQTPEFPWPDGKKMALSLSFDDARSSQPVNGIPLLNEYDVDATFYVLPGQVNKQLEGWKIAVETGHEIANHSYYHPCSGNFGWSIPLEDYTMDRMREELKAANRAIYEMLGVRAVSYAYPCGQITIGRGINSQSFIPLISELFLTGREWLSEAPVDPWYCDMAALTGMKMDNMEFEEILPLIQSASEKGQWLILAGHEMADEGNQTTYLSMLRQLCEYAGDPANSIWIAPVGTIAEYVQEKREKMLDSINIPRLTYAGGYGKIVLQAKYGEGKGPEIKYMPEREAFGWITGQDRVEWDVQAAIAGLYIVEVIWSVSDDEAGSKFILEAGDVMLEGIVSKTGSRDSYTSSIIGAIHLDKGYQKVIFRPFEDDGQGALPDLRRIALTPK